MRKKLIMMMVVISLSLTACVGGNEKSREDIFYLVPFLATLYYSVINNMAERKWAGLKNFGSLFANNLYMEAGTNTVLFILASVPLGMFLLLGWVFVMTGTTIVFLQYERNRMPEVRTGYPQKGTIVYHCQVKAMVLNEENAELTVPHLLHLHSRLFQEGTNLGVGVVTAYENSGEGHHLKIRLEEKGRGERNTG